MASKTIRTFDTTKCHSCKATRLTDGPPGHSCPHAYVCGVCYEDGLCDGEMPCYFIDWEGDCFFASLTAMQT